MKKDSKIFIAGHKGLVGSSIYKILKDKGYTNLMTLSKSELDLRDTNGVRDWFLENNPEYVFLAAAKVGGIKANIEQKGSFIYDNIMIQTNIIHNSYIRRVKKLIFLGSSCIYPKLCKQPIKEEYLLSGLLEPSNDAYAIAKIAGIKMCQAYNEQYNTNFISVMPTNLFGIGDNYHHENSHVIPGLIYKIHTAKINGIKDIVCWGDGTPKREFLFNTDLAEACIFLMENYNSSDIINIGTGSDMMISELANSIKDVIYPEGNIIFDNNLSMNGTPRKTLDISKIKALGWSPKVSFIEGIKLAYQDFLKK
jgi:GDP-L-fucose synthase